MDLLLIMTVICKMFISLVVFDHTHHACTHVSVEPVVFV